MATERRKSIETKTYFFRNSRNSFAVSDLFRTLPLCTGFAYSFQFTDQFNNSQTFHGTDSACSEATERVADIRSTLAGYLASAEDKAEYFSQVKTFADTQQDLVWNSSDHTLSFSTKFADSQQLSVILEIFYPGKTETSVLKILQWSTESNGTWNPDNHQNLFKGE